MMREKLPPGGSGHLILWSEVQSGHELQLLCKKNSSWIWISMISTNLTHLSQDQKSVRRGSKERRWLIDGGFLLIFVSRDLRASFFFVLSKVALLHLPLMLNSFFFYFAAIFQKDFFKQFLHLTIKQKFFNPYIGDLFLWKSWFLQTSLQLLILYHLLNSCERFGCSVNITQDFLKLLLLFFFSFSLLEFQQRVFF